MRKMTASLFIVGLFLALFKGDCQIRPKAQNQEESEEGCAERKSGARHIACPSSLRARVSSKSPATPLSRCSSSARGVGPSIIPTTLRALPIHAPVARVT